MRGCRSKHIRAYIFFRKTLSLCFDAADTKLKLRAYALVFAKYRHLQRFPSEIYALYALNPTAPSHVSYLNFRNRPAFHERPRYKDPLYQRCARCLDQTDEFLRRHLTDHLSILSDGRKRRIYQP